MLANFGTAAWPWDDPPPLLLGAALLLLLLPAGLQRSHLVFPHYALRASTLNASTPVIKTNVMDADARLLSCQAHRFIDCEGS